MFVILKIPADLNLLVKRSQLYWALLPFREVSMDTFSDDPHYQIRLFYVLDIFNHFKNVLSLNKTANISLETF
jgi:hypothetical protein